MSVRPSVGPSVRRSVGPSLGRSVRHTRVEFPRNGPNLNKIASGIRKYAIWKTIQRQVRGQLARTHLLSELCSTCFLLILDACTWRKTNLAWMICLFCVHVMLISPECFVYLAYIFCLFNLNVLSIWLIYFAFLTWMFCLFGITAAHRMQRLFTEKHSQSSRVQVAIGIPCKASRICHYLLSRKKLSSPIANSFIL